MKVSLLAYLDNNLGDDLMIKIIAENYKEIDFYIYTDSSVINNTFKSFDNIIVKSKKYLNSDLSTVDAIVSIGGSIFILNNFKACLFRILKIKFLIKAKLRGIKILTIGCNFGPFNKIGKLISRLEIFLNDFVIVRDDEYKEIINNKLISNKAVISSDFVFSKKIKKNNVKNKCFLGISAYRSLKRDENNYCNYEALAEIADSYIEKTNCEVKVFAFDSEFENDISAAHHIYEIAKNKSKIQIIPYLGDIDNFLHEFSECSFHICIRFHSAVLSDIYGINFYPIAYSNKMINLIKNRYPDFDVKNIECLKKESGLKDEILNYIFNEIECCGQRYLPEVNSDYFDNLDKFLKNK